MIRIEGYLYSNIYVKFEMLNIVKCNRFMLFSDNIRDI